MTDVNIVEVSPAEIDRIWYTLNAAFPAHAPLVNILFPGRGTPDGDASIINRLRAKAERTAHSHSHFIEARLDGESLGAAIWTELVAKPSSNLADLEDVQRIWPDPADRAFASLIWEQYMVHRGDFVLNHADANRPVWVLEWLGVSSEARRKGVGEALTKWGRDRADTADAESITEGNVVGLPLYRRCGYAPVARIDFEVGDELAGRPLPDLMFMRRVREGGRPCDSEACYQVSKDMDRQSSDLCG